MDLLGMYFRFLMVLLFLSFITPCSHGQITIGFKAGYTHAWRANIAFDTDDEYIHKNGFQLSLPAYVKLSRYISLGLEPGFVRRVSGTSFSFSDAPIDRTLLLNYIELPLMISGRYPLWNERLKMNVKAGYGISKLIRAVQEFSSLPGSRQEVFLPGSSWINTLDHGFYSGLGVEYNLGQNRIFAEYGFYLGMTDTNLFDFSKNRSTHLVAGFSTGF